MLSGRGPEHAPGTTCDHCGVREDAGHRLKSCDGCFAARYCGVTCHDAAWPSHKAECARMKARREEVTRVDIVG